ncbi:DUF5680 domain-containing protein [Spirochaeta isovalerica]|uniref:Transcriptional regulator with XRE-family HTH domain n=1 Tax=Spirochaeta isovalerica TaxID=150 RepID=A0A841R3U4_9SPIO|nr:DUF5680 domain-containing protein [Spirochaeta isovalerica]MBB6479744.1 transcriptional regulator with XRE-family HTH domain [Spirochaeta isovalerica]
MELAQRIQHLRKEAGLTQEELGERLEISRQSITKWENGSSLPEIDRLIDLSLIFGVSVDYLLKGPNEYVKSGTGEKNERSELISFLCEAKRNTYAAHGNEVESSRPGSHDLYYRQGQLSYLDSYFGGNRFAGGEVLFVRDAPFWSMNYAGRVLGENFSGDFLKESLLAVPPELPFRGPPLHRKDSFSYHCKVNGDFDWFEGEEEIFFQTAKVYECRFHGGVVE